jgi:hypothetical protein
MIINAAPQNEAIMSNVGEIGEFRIRNSAKAFNILSSGLYANKVRAIIRELSCNAVDSHTAAGKQDTPFDVHLPNSLEPWFSIRDYGTGLSADQVTNIYTTYFESTKTASNEFIGALGLGSKSPFSYTDNFTVTAIKDGIKGIYTAFINEQGVPSIAKMMDEQTTEPAGVEVRFAVEERYDFSKFRDEARYVYEYFKLRPVVSGNSDFKFKDPSYKEMNIIPGVHYSDNNHSYAIMGNIKYPLTDIPSAEKSLGGLQGLLHCGLVMEFNIGELDFQASREGLSYIPQTVNAIKTKLEQLNAQLATHIAQEADKITNLWERAGYLEKRFQEHLFNQAVVKYVTDTKFELYTPQLNRWNAMKQFKFEVKDLAKDYNMVIRGFSKSRSYNVCSTLKPTHSYTTVANNNVFTDEWEIRVSDDVYFVVNDTKVGATERAKFHWKNSTDANKSKSHNSNVYVIEAADKSKPMLTNAFFKALSTPPEDKILKASSLLEKERASGIGQNVTIMRLEEGRNRSWRDRGEMVWRDGGKASSFDAKQTYYYLPLSGYKNLGIVEDVKQLEIHLRKAGIYTQDIYGVRKGDIEAIKAQKNWVNLDEHVKGKLAKLGQADVMGLVKQSIDWKELFQYNATKHIANKSSPYMVLFNTFKDVKESDQSLRQSLEWLCRQYKVATSTNVDPASLIDKYNKEVEAIFKRYPLIKGISKYSTEGADLAEYINLIDQTKGV